MSPSDFRLLGDFEGVINLDAQVFHGRLKLGVTEQQLHSTQVLGAPIDQCRLGPSHGMRPIFGRVQSQILYPVAKNTGVLPGPQVG